MKGATLNVAPFFIHKKPTPNLPLYTSGFVKGF
ncbi:hypothetical protein AEQU1_01241 [Aequorivita sp. CIP111184]|nr:hypothetical protein AEQU1_01241 [Aequorivita sp. CIP111184]